VGRDAGEGFRTGHRESRHAAVEEKHACRGSKRQEAKRAAATHLEALGRTLAGLAPWLAASGLDSAEEALREKMAAQTRKALANAVEPTSADQLDFTVATQNLVDAAFLALGLSRAKNELWDALDTTTRERFVTALQGTRKFKPGKNNWLLFSATIEAFLASIGASWLPEPIETAITAHEEWYQGDGMYGDGPRVSLGLLQQLRHPAHAARRA
jgi:hypothetical protein